VLTRHMLVITLSLCDQIQRQHKAWPVQPRLCTHRALFTADKAMQRDQLLKVCVFSCRLFVSGQEALPHFFLVNMLRGELSIQAWLQRCDSLMGCRYASGVCNPRHPQPC
jgi:hypothetical protein